jgi:hypothetical protein
LQSLATGRIFSQGGDLITKKHNRTSGANTRYVLCLRFWGVFVSDDDFDEIEEQEEDRDVKEKEIGRPVEEGETDETDVEDVVEDIVDSKIDYKKKYL